ncbi:MAG: putative metal-binding motif-containing protein [Myxococcota bacterium]
MRLGLSMVCITMMAGCQTTDICARFNLDCVPPEDANFIDADGDGFQDEDDCEPDDDTIFPGAEETCDQIDNNCDGQIDEGLAAVWQRDADNDRYGVLEGATCHRQDGFIKRGDGKLDCDDDDRMINPNAAEACDGVDNNCDGVVDEGLMRRPAYRDVDGDGVGDDGAMAERCETELPEGWVALSGDCDDANAEISPLVDELCFDGIDNDCDGLFDEDGCTLVMVQLHSGTDRPEYSLGALQRLAGDHNGDGHADILIGDSDDEVRLLYGPFGHDRAMDVDAVSFAFSPAEEGFYARSRFPAGHGDINGDGYDDLLIRRETGHPDWNAAYVILGPSRVDDVISFDDADLKLSTDGTVWLGDADGDGLDDVGTIGQLHRFSEDIGDFVKRSLTNEDPGVSRLQRLGDVNGDGIDDYSDWAGTVLLGPVGDRADAMTVQAPVDLSGWWQSVGDVDGDGAGELVLGVLTDTDGDSADDTMFADRVVSPSVDGDVLVLETVATFTPFGAINGTITYSGYTETEGASALTSFDFDGDGDQDLMFSDGGRYNPDDESYGRAWLLLSPPAGEMSEDDAVVTFHAESIPWFSNTVSLSAGADLDGDGLPDAALGAPHTRVGADQQGRLYILPGVDGL